MFIFLLAERQKYGQGLGLCLHDHDFRVVLVSVSHSSDCFDDNRYQCAALLPGHQIDRDFKGGGIFRCRVSWSDTGIDDYNAGLVLGIRQG
jgi:hypothetical protein